MGRTVKVAGRTKKVARGIPRRTTVADDPSSAASSDDGSTPAAPVPARCTPPPAAAPAASAAAPAAASHCPAKMAAAPAPAASDRPAKRQRTDGVAVPGGLCAFHHVGDWCERHEADFVPPICNRLMHRGQLTVMIVGGPNTRKDFHLEEGSEFFFQLRGNMELPTVQRGKRKLVKIDQGQVFCLPSRIPHSPQRPMEGSLGLVIERRRENCELDGLIYYTDFETCEKVRWERFFECKDLGKDLVPVAKAYEEFGAQPEAVQSAAVFPEKDRPVVQNRVSEVPVPFLFEDFLLAHAEQLAEGEALPLMGPDHPDREFEILVVGGRSEQRGQLSANETWLYQHRGTAHVAVGGGTLTLGEGCCCVVQSGTSYDVSRCEGSVGLVVRQDPEGNKGVDEEQAQLAALRAAGAACA